MTMNTERPNSSQALARPQHHDWGLQEEDAKAISSIKGYHLYHPSRRQAAPAFAHLVEALRYRSSSR
jgi:hypothetical protein